MVTCRRGEYLLKWAADTGVKILNEGNEPTLIRKNGTSYIDMTMITDGGRTPTPLWQVLSEETLSDRRYVLTEFSNGRPTRKRTSVYGPTNKKRQRRGLTERLESTGRSFETITRQMGEVYHHTTHKIYVRRERTVLVAGKQSQPGQRGKEIQKKIPASQVPSGSR